MANLEEIKNKLNSINNGKDFRNGDGLGASTINDIINLSKDIVENVKKTGKMFLSNSETPIYGISVGGFQEPQFINPNFLSSDIQVGDKFLSVSYDADNESDKYLSIFKVTELPTELDDNIMASLQSYVKLPQGSGGNINVDSELSETSENPVQNKVVAEALSNKVGFYDFNTKEAYQNGEMVELSNVPIFLRTSKGIYLSNAPDGSGRKVLGVTFAPDSLVKSQSENLPFSTNQISLAVRAGLTKPRITWTDDEKALARENLGISGGGTKLYKHIFRVRDRQNFYNVSEFVIITNCPNSLLLRIREYSVYTKGICLPSDFHSNYVIFQAYCVRNIDSEQIWEDGAVIGQPSKTSSGFETSYAFIDGEYYEVIYQIGNADFGNILLENELEDVYTIVTEL